MTGDDVSSGDLVSFVLYELQFSSAVEVRDPHCNMNQIPKGQGSQLPVFDLCAEIVMVVLLPEQFKQVTPNQACSGQLEQVTPNQACSEQLEQVTPNQACSGQLEQVTPNQACSEQFEQVTPNQACSGTPTQKELGYFGYLDCYQS